MLSEKKILIITPKFPIPDFGACEKDRLEGLMQLQRLGWQVSVISKVFDWQDKKEIKQFADKYGIKIKTVSYKFHRPNSIFDKILKIVKIILKPKYWDSSAHEYFDPEIQKIVEQEINNFNPKIVWFDYTYLWPLYKIVKRYKIPIVTRSINIEAYHFLEEDGYNIFNFLKFIPKIFTEFRAVAGSSLFFSITPKEQKIYKKLTRNKDKIVNLPLRAMPRTLVNNRVITKSDKINIYFMGSTYNVAHNCKALEFIIADIAPKIEKIMPNKYLFHIFGAKIPSEFNSYIKDNIAVRGYKKNIGDFLDDMDVALIPSLYGAGMQQKIFESLARGIPTITSPHGLASYGFENNIHLLTATTSDDFIQCLLKLQDVLLRGELSKNSIKLSQYLFSQQVIDGTVKKIDDLIK